MAVESLYITTNVDEWAKAGFAAAKYLTSRQAVESITAVMTDRMRRLMREQFNREGFGQSGRWKQLSENYRDWKQRHYPGKRILELTGALKRSWTTPTGNIAIGSKTAQGILFRFGSLDEKAEWHQYGAPTNNLPARRQLDMTEQQLRGAALAVARTMEDGLFSRRFFDAKQTRYYGLAVRFTGWERIDLP